MRQPWDWDRVAALPGLSAVIDYQQQETHWARYFDALHRCVLAEKILASATDRFLDFGCGVGRISRWLAERVGEVVGVDPSAEMIRQARARTQNPNITYHHILQPTPNDHLVLGAPFDGITAVWVLQHILDDQAFGAAIDLFAAVLRRGSSVTCIDRLLREAPDPGDSTYMRCRPRSIYEAAFVQRGFRAVDSYAVIVQERVRDSALRTWWVKGGYCDPDARVAGDLRWARRQQHPIVADYLYCFELL
jgi:SAM-dependent methyltransferase